MSPAQPKEQSPLARSTQENQTFRRTFKSITALSFFLLLILQHKNPALANKKKDPRYFGSICNGTEETLNVAIGIRPTTCGPGGCTKQYVPIRTEGWWVVPPRNCKFGIMLDTDYQNKHARGERFITAYTESYRWEGNYNLCVKNSAFTMLGEIGYQDCKQSHGYQRRFRKILSRPTNVSFQPRNGLRVGAPEYQFLHPSN